MYSVNQKESTAMFLNCFFAKCFTTVALGIVFSTIFNVFVLALKKGLAVSVFIALRKNTLIPQFPFHLSLEVGQNVSGYRF